MLIRFLIVTVAATTLAFWAPHARAAVPCDVTMPDANDGCGKPFVDGVVDHQWVGIIIHFSGSNGGADALYPFTVGRGANGLLTINLDPIKPEGQYGDRMEAWFAGGKLYVLNAVYLPGESHFNNKNVTVRQFGFVGKALVRQRTASVSASATHAQMYTAFAKAAY